MFKFAPILILFALSFQARSQYAEWMFDRQTIKEGLSNTHVSDIIKDSKGFIWIATQNGLNKYNAYSFTVYKTDASNESSISSDVINCVFEDSQKRLWIGTENGLNQYDRKMGFFRRWLPDSTNLRPTVVKEIVEDANGILWIGTGSQCVLRFDPVKNDFQKINPVNEINPRFYQALVRSMLIDDAQNLWIGTNGFGIIKYSIPSNEVHWFFNVLDSNYPVELNYTFGLHQDRNGDIWAGTYVGGLAKFEPDSASFRVIPNPYNQDALIKNGIMSIGETSNGHLLLGSNGGGLFFFDQTTEKFYQNYRFDPTDENSISDDFIGNIFTDSTNITWFGTENGGISIYDPGRRKFELYKKKGNSTNTLPGNVVNTIQQTNNGLIWIGTENNGYASLDRKTNTYRQFVIQNSQPSRGNTFVKSIISDGTNGLWIAAHMGGIIQTDENGKIIAQISPEIQVDKQNWLAGNDNNTLVYENGTLWIAGFRGLEKMSDGKFDMFCAADDLKDSSCFIAIHSIYSLNETDIVVGYRSQGFSFFNKVTQEFSQKFTTETSDISSNEVNAFCLDQKGRLWIGTGNGLNQFHFEDSSITSIFKEDGLPDNQIMGILEDDVGNLWVSTSYGLCCYNPDQSTFQNFYEQDGLQSNVFRQGAFYKGLNGELFFGGVGGFNAFYPEKIKSNPTPPKLEFTDFQLFNKSVIPEEQGILVRQIEMTDTIVLNYDQSIFSFEFTAFNYTLSEKNEYAYKLEGFNEDWQYIGTRRYITFTNISPGSYTLRVKACNNDGVWNEEGISMHLIIKPPFWETWWFRGLLIICMLLLIYGIYRLRVRSIQKQNRLLEREVVIRTQEVVEQKNEIANQKELVDQKNRDITSSIRYSKRIQESFLPDLQELQKDLSESFVLFKPKDIVSGDFYWVEKSEDKNTLFISVADCTGHGVPGAMVSVLGNNGLNRSVNELHFNRPNEILDNLNAYVKQAFDRKDKNVQDGMDIALCAIDLSTNIMQFSGANNPVWIARNNEIIALKGTKQPIGKYDTNKPFELTDFQLESNDWVFLFSDGFADQFGGPKGKKYKYAQLKSTLLGYNKSGHTNFSNYLDQEFKNWKGDSEQVDDVCILGFQMK